MKLADLAAGIPGARIVGDPTVEIAALTSDSRRAGPGALFVAIPGEHEDGHAYAGAAFAAGAAAAVVESPSVLPAGAVALIVPDSRRAASAIAAAFYGHADEDLQIVGVTGTNGKTTATYMITAVLDAAGLAAARIGTLGASFGTREWPLANTTPLPLELHALFRELRDAGAGAVAMEVSSHALALARVDDVAFACGVLTNVTRDHLDFHGTIESYAAAKRRLFELAPAAILNADDPFGKRWAAELAARDCDVVTFGIDNPQSAVRAVDVACYSGGSDFHVGGMRFSLPLPGRFNVSNALAAIATARHFGVADMITAEALAAIPPIPGRMETFVAAGFAVIVDYAHTPDALENVLKAARESASGRTIVVFGCGGDRDRGKRPEMGALADRLADEIIVTSDNPRSEDPAAIAEEITAGVGNLTHLSVILDRRLAIGAAIECAKPGDVIVVAGKGHERNQIARGETIAFDDREEVKLALERRGAVLSGQSS